MRFSTTTRASLLLALLALGAAPATAQYRNRGRRATQPIVTLTPRVGWLFGFGETAVPAVIVDPGNPPGNGLREFDGRPYLGGELRVGRRIQLFGSGFASVGGNIDRVSGAAVGLTLRPLAAHPDIRLVGGVGWLWVPDGGTYVGFRGGLDLTVWRLNDWFGVELGGSVHLSGGADEKDGIEYRLENGYAFEAHIGLNVSPWR